MVSLIHKNFGNAAHANAADAYEVKMSTLLS